jgi:hypothetical protein
MRWEVGFGAQAVAAGNTAACQIMRRPKVMTLEAADEFIRRFLQHTVPGGFQRIRHIGFLANRYRAEKFALCRELLAALPPAPRPRPGPRQHAFSHDT